MGGVLRELGARYDIVLIDSPPIFPITDASILAAYVDGVVLVVRGARTDRQIARDALNRLHFMNATVVGVVLNGVDPSSGSYREYRHYFAS
jgi:receptor protein-tyrosine kinase